MTTPAHITAQIVDLLTRWDARQDQLDDWLTGAPTGGPNGDGRYPLTNASGVTGLFLSLPSVIAQVAGPAALAGAARDDAEAAAALAQAAKAAAEFAKSAAEEAQESAVDLRSLVSVQQLDVAAKWSDVGFWRGEFNSRYLGPKATPPTTNNTEGALTAGALYFDTALGAMRVWSGTAWVGVAPIATRANAPFVRATSSADQTLPSGVLTILDYDTAETNNAPSLYSVSSTGRITVAEAGIYAISTGVVVQASAVDTLSSVSLGLFVNGAIVAVNTNETTLAVSASRGQSISTQIALSAGAVVDARVNAQAVSGAGNGAARRAALLLGQTATQVNHLSLVRCTAVA